MNAQHQAEEAVAARCVEAQGRFDLEACRQKPLNKLSNTEGRAVLVKHFICRWAVKDGRSTTFEVCDVSEFNEAHQDDPVRYASAAHRQGRQSAPRGRLITGAAVPFVNFTAPGAYEHVS